MGKLPRSAVYFSRTPEVDEFLEEFIRVRTWHLVHKRASDAPSDSPVPYSRNKAKEGEETASLDRAEQDEFIAVAKQMKEGSSIHLDAFISLTVSYDDVLNSLDGKQLRRLKPQRFELHKIMKNAKVKGRKSFNPTPADDLKSVLREAEEKKYQRLVADVRERLDDKTVRITDAKPPIIGGLNVILEIPLTFVGAYSVAGSLGVQDKIKRVIIGIVFSFVAILVSTLLVLMRSAQ